MGLAAPSPAQLLKAQADTSTLLKETILIVAEWFVKEVEYNSQQQCLMKMRREVRNVETASCRLCLSCSCLKSRVNFLSYIVLERRFAPNPQRQNMGYPTHTA